MSDQTAGRVFISYSHDDDAHSARVAALADRLRADGIDCQIDQYFIRPKGGWIHWMNGQIDQAETILVVCTETYRRRFDRGDPPSEGRGVRWESLLMQNQLYRASSVNKKLVPVLFDQDDEEHIPDILYDAERACLDPAKPDAGYDHLVRVIRRDPPHPMPPLGKVGGPPKPSPLPTLSVQPAFFKPASGPSGKRPMASSPDTKKPPIFICYAHDDNQSTETNKSWLDQLLLHLKPLKRQGDLVVFSDKDIAVGDAWHKKIQAQLRAAEVAVLIVGPGLLASEYVCNSELPVLLKKREDDGLKILSLIVEPCLVKETRFKYPDPRNGPDELTLGSLQAFNSPNKTLTEMKEPDAKRAILKVAQELLKIANP